MLKDTYKQELSGVSASGNFKKNTKALLLQQMAAAQAAENTQPPKSQEAAMPAKAGLQVIKGGKAKKAPIKNKLAAAVFAVLLLGGTVLALRSFTGGMQSAAPQGTYESGAVASLPAGRGAEGLAEDAAPAAEAPKEAEVTGELPRLALPQNFAHTVTIPLILENLGSYPPAAAGVPPGLEAEGEVPVYTKPAIISAEQAQEMAAPITAALGLVATGNEAHPGGEGYTLMAGDNVRIEVWGQGVLALFAQPFVPGWGAPPQSLEAGQHTAYLQQFVQQYPALFAQMQTPALEAVQLQSEGGPQWEYRVYDAAPTGQEALLARGNAVTLLATQQGIHMLCLPQGKTQETAHYPLLAQRTARQMLGARSADTKGIIGPAHKPEQEEIEGVAFTYLPAGNKLLPYYIFYAKLPGGTGAGGRHQYGRWYVPAIQPGWYE